jgi:hypothetical protein
MHGDAATSPAWRFRNEKTPSDEGVFHVLSFVPSDYLPAMTSLPS